MKGLVLLLVSSVSITVVVGRVDLPTIKKCANMAFSKGVCSNSDLSSVRKGRLDVAIACNFSGNAAVFAGECAKDDSNGLYCGATQHYVKDVISATDTCSDIISDSSVNCSTECKNSLTALRNDLGCCINTIFNTSVSAHSSYMPLFTYSLWKSCGVETVLAGGCPGGDSYTFTPQRTCSYTELVIMVLEVSCTPAVISDLEDAVTSEEIDCKSYMQYVRELCSVDSNNDFCLAGDITADMKDYITPITQNCDTDCNSACKSDLENFAKDRGCCVRSLYNSTFAELRIEGILLNNSFDASPYGQCGVDDPGTCGVFSTQSGSGRMLTSLGMLASVLLLLTLGVRV